MTTDWALYEKLLVEKEQDTETILIEAEKHHRQDPTNTEVAKLYRLAKANHEDAKMQRIAWNEGTEEKLKGMEQSGLYTAQKDHGTRDII